MGRPRQFDESAVIDAALDAFWRGGLRATSVDDLLRVTGLSRSSLYGSFGNKQTLLRRAVERYVDLQADELTQGFAGRGLREALLHIFNRIAEDNNGGRGCLLINGLGELGTDGGKTLAIVRDGLERIERTLSGLVRRADPAGAAGPPARVATDALAAIAGLRTLQRSGLPAERVRDSACSLATRLAAPEPSTRH